jgi:hypothetical protein
MIPTLTRATAERCDGTAHRGKERAPKGVDCYLLKILRRRKREKRFVGRRDAI